MTTWALSITITCPKQQKDAANLLLQQLGWGPNNINTELQGNKWATTLPCNAEMLDDLQKLADQHPKLDITISTRPEGRPPAKVKCQGRAVSKFDKAEYKDPDVNNRKKAKVEIIA